MAKKQGKRKFRILIGIIVLVLSPFLLIGTMMGLAAAGAFGKLPDFKELEDPKSNLASEVYSYDGKLLGKFYIENRSNIRYEDINPVMIDALISTEDKRYYKHAGIDAEAIMRVVKGVITMKSKGGGSTITQQLAKLLFHDKPKSRWERVLQKFKEWVIALKLERSYTKKEIVTMYLNQADFGHNIYGISTASKIFFDKTPATLETQQAALLVGLLKAPTAYSPIKNPERCKNRRNTVLELMVKNRKLSKEDSEKFKKKPLIEDEVKMAERVDKNTYGHGDLAPYFLEELKKDLLLWCETHENPATKKPYNLYKDGLRIYTTIDSRYQKYAEQAVNEYLPELQDLFFKKKKGKKNAPFDPYMKADKIEELIRAGMKNSDRYRGMKEAGKSEKEIADAFNTPVKMKVFSWRGDIDTVMSPRDSVIYYKFFLQNGMMAMDPHTGYIKAWVGGINFRHFKYDHVRAGVRDKEGKKVIAGGGRQVGSTFKPFVYMLAMDAQRSPCEQVPNVDVCIEQTMQKPWCPSNSGTYKEGQMVTLREALANSINKVSALLIKQYGPEAVVRYCKKLGMVHEIPAAPSIALGTADLSVYEMVGAYGTFFNKGKYIEPTFLLRVEDKGGNILQDFTQNIEKRQVFSEETAWLMVQLMKGVVLQGTAGRLRSKYKFKEAVAGKTGTTQNNSDGWFMGATPDVVAGVWTGAEDRSVHFMSTADGQGANMALPVWALFMRKVYDDKSILINRGDFEKPRSEMRVEMNCNEYFEEQRFDDEPNPNIFDN